MTACDGDPNVSELSDCHFLSRECRDFSILEDHIPLSEIMHVEEVDRFRQ